MNRTRPSSGFGASAIPYQEIESYCNLYGIDLLVEELELLKRFDAVVLDLYAKKQEQQQKQANKKKN